MGQVISDSFNYMKAYTKLEVKLDIFEVYKEARNRVENDLRELKGPLGKIVNKTCEDLSFKRSSEK